MPVAFPPTSWKALFCLAPRLSTSRARRPRVAPAFPWDALPPDVLDSLLRPLSLCDIHRLRLAGVGATSEHIHLILSLAIRTRIHELRSIWTIMSPEDMLYNFRIYLPCHWSRHHCLMKLRAVGIAALNHHHPLFKKRIGKWPPRPTDIVEMTRMRISILTVDAARAMAMVMRTLQEVEMRNCVVVDDGNSEKVIVPLPPQSRRDDGGGDRGTVLRVAHVENEGLEAECMGLVSRHEKRVRDERDVDRQRDDDECEQDAVQDDDVDGGGRAVQNGVGLTTPIVTMVGAEDGKTYALFFPLFAQRHEQREDGGVAVRTEVSYRGLLRAAAVPA